MTQLYALSFDSAVYEGGQRLYVYKFVPISAEQAKGQVTVDEIPDPLSGVIQLAGYGTEGRLKVVGFNRFRYLTAEEQAAPVTEKDSMMYRLVLELPFKILLVHSRSFHRPMAAMHFCKRHYPTFPMEVWDQEQVNRWSGHRFNIPIRRSKYGRNKTSHRTLLH